MSSHIKYSLAFLALLMVFSCSDKTQKVKAEFDSYNLVVISHTNDGKLLGYIAFNDLSDIRMIRINPKKGYKDINVTLFGRNRHEMLQKDIAVISKTEVGYKGCVEVSIQDGIAIGCMGNGVNVPSPLTDASIEEVINNLGEGRLQSEANDYFEIIK